MAREILSLAEAQRPEFTQRQKDFCRELIGMGLTRNTIIGLVCGTDVNKLNHAQIGAGNRLIEKSKDELGYGIMDARRAQSPYMASCVRGAARSLSIRVRIA